MFDARHPLGWPFYLPITSLWARRRLRHQQPRRSAMWSIARTERSRGTQLISWPTFRTSGRAVRGGGEKERSPWARRPLSVALAPTTGATPATGTFYTVVYQLDDGTVKTEFWVVTSTSPTTIAAVRTTLGSGNSVTTLGSASFMSKAGDTMTGPLQMPAEKSDIRRRVCDRIVNAAITVAISAATAMHDYWGIK